MAEADAIGSKRKSSTIARIIFAVLLAAGLAFLAWPVVKDAVFEKNTADTVAGYTDTVAGLSDVERDKILASAEKYNTALAEGTEKAGKGYAKQLSFYASGMMSKISIPSISVELPIFHGTNDDVLAKGVGHMPTTSLPIGGESTHCVLTGHSGLSQTRLFDDLALLKEGDVFYLETLGKTLAYQVSSIEVVEPDDVSSLKIVKGKDMCTLITCYPYGINSHRLLVHGERCDLEESADTSFLSIFDSQFFRKYIAPIALFLVVLLIILLLRIVITAIKKRRRKHKPSGIAVAAQKHSPSVRKSRQKSGDGVSILAVTAFAISLVIAFYPYAQQILLERSYEQTATAVADGSILSDNGDGDTDTAKKQLLAAAKAYNASLVTEGQQFEDAWTFEQGSSSLAGLVDSRFGTIRIPDMDVKLPLLLGASYENMAEGATVLGGTSIPIGGKDTNSVIAGHRGWRYWPYFRDIEKLVPGQSVVYIDNPWSTLAYRVVSTEIIAPTDTDKILIQPGKDLITLITCHPYLSSGIYRYVVTCERIPLSEAGDNSEADISGLIADTVSDLAYLSEGLENPQHCGGIIALEQVIRFSFAAIAVLVFTSYIVSRRRQGNNKGKEGDM